MMSTGIYSIGISGIAAAQLNLLATEHNVVNANTPGYTRQRAVQATNIAVNTGAGSIGQGVHVQTIERMYDRYLTGQVNSAQTSLSGIDAYYSEIKQIDNLLADPSAGLTPALQDFFSGVQQVASNPSLVSARESMISSATTLVNRFHSLDTRLGEIADEVNGKIQDAVTSINSFASEIADLNQRIIISESSYGQPANDLLDQRDSLINELNKLIKVTTNTNSNGSFNVFIGSGQQLVVGNQAMQLTANAASADPARIVVGLQTAGGGSLELPEKLVNGGELGGLIAFRSETLDRAANELGRMAASVALTFNAQHALGQDLLGNASGDAAFNADFFSVTGIVPTVSANTHNTGSLAVSAQLVDPPPYGPELSDGNFYTNLTTSDYRLVFNGGTSYTLTRLSDNTAFPLTATAPATLSLASEGLSLSLGAGAGVAGDSYLIQPTRNAAKNILVNPVIAADPRTVAAAVPFRSSAVDSNKGSGAISAGKTVPGFDVGLLRTNDVTITYTAGAPNQLSFAGLVAPNDQLTIKLPGSPEGAPVPSPVAYTQGMTISVAGMSFTLTGQPTVGDTFKLSLNSAGVADGRNALALGQLQTKNTMVGAKATFQGAYAQMVASNGIKTRELKVTGDAQQAVLDQAQASRDALSGVNLDEEAANLIRFQQAYQASAKLLEVGKTLFDTVLQLG
jgi:flagellar hook-associated protein 1 FlgK